MSYKKKLLFISLAILILFLNGCGKQQPETTEQAATEEFVEEGGICAGYTKVPGQLSCEEAIIEILSENPGKITSMAEVVTDEGDAWLIGVEFSQPVIIEGEEVASTKIFRLKSSKTHYADLCSRYEKVFGQISCEEAIIEVLSKNPGTITSMAEVVTDEGDAWLIGVEFSQPIVIEGEEVTSTKIFRLKS